MMLQEIQHPHVYKGLRTVHFPYSFFSRTFLWYPCLLSLVQEDSPLGHFQNPLKFALQPFLLLVCKWQGITRLQESWPHLLQMATSPCTPSPRALAKRISYLAQQNQKRIFKNQPIHLLIYKTQHFTNCLPTALPTVLLKCSGVRKATGNSLVGQE